PQPNQTMSNMRTTRRTFLGQTAALTLAAANLPRGDIVAVERRAGSGVIDIGQRRELFIDDYLIERLVGKANQRLGQPQPQELVLVHDAPWEGSGSGYHCVFEDNGG